MTEQKYRYNPETLSYERVRVSIAKRIRRIALRFLIFLTPALLASIFVYKFYNPEPVSFASSSQSIKDQLNALDEISTNLDMLSSFIDQQRLGLAQEYENIEYLKIEKARLDSIVSLNSEKANLLFREHERRTSQRIWLDRFIGFLLGLVSSLVATFLYNSIFLYRERGIIER